MPRFKPKGVKRKHKRGAGVSPKTSTAAPAPRQVQYVWGRNGLKVQKEPRHGE